MRAISLSRYWNYWKKNFFQRLPVCMFIPPQRKPATQKPYSFCLHRLLHLVVAQVVPLYVRLAPFLQFKSSLVASIMCSSKSISSGDRYKYIYLYLYYTGTGYSIWKICVYLYLGRRWIKFFFFNSFSMGVVRSHPRILYVLRKCLFHLS